VFIKLYRKFSKLYRMLIENVMIGLTKQTSTIISESLRDCMVIVLLCNFQTFSHSPFLVLVPLVKPPDTTSLSVSEATW